MRLDDRTIDLSAEEGARVIALGLVREAVDAAEGLAAGKDAEALHDFRVAVRRLRSALRAFRPWLEGSVRPRHERRLRRIAASTNEARDAEVQLAWLRSRRAALGSDRRRAGLELLEARFEARSAAVRRGADPARAADRFRRAAGKLDRRLRTYEREVEAAGTPAASLGGALATLLRDHVQTLRDRLDAVQSASDQEGVHAARITGKRLRYLLEPLRGHRLADAGGPVARLKRLQDVLGELHDAHVLSAELRDVLVDAASDRARHLHEALFASAGPAAPARACVRPSPRAGILAVARLVRERCDALHADLEREWRAGGVEELAAEVTALAAALEAHAGGKLERARKYLLAALPPRAAGAPCQEIEQGWLPGARLRERLRRVRGADGERYWRAIEQGAGVTRLEAEEQTTREVFEALWPLTEGRRVAKRRHVLHDGPITWEIDVFADRDLVLAEVELPAQATEVALPEWLRPLVVREVTDDPAYLNEHLAAATGPPPVLAATPEPSPAPEPVVAEPGPSATRFPG